MELLKEIKDVDEVDESNFKLREASRAVLFDEDNNIPLLFVSRHNYHKLPGGGIEPEEDKEQALIREVLEEVGSSIEVSGEVGKVIEYRTECDLKQISYCYFGRIISKGDTDFSKRELNQGFTLIWVPIDEAINKIESDKPDNYEGTFIQKRDLVLLKKAKELTSPYYDHRPMLHSRYY